MLNGIDEQEWDPARDPYLLAHYDREHLEGKTRIAAALIAECGFPNEPDWPIVGMVSRLVEQKGIDLLEHGERRAARSSKRAS